MRKQKRLEQFIAEAEVDLRRDFEREVKAEANRRLRNQEDQKRREEADQGRKAERERERAENFARAPQVLSQEYGPKLAAAFDVEALYDVLYLRALGQFVVCRSDTPAAANMRDWARYLEPILKEKGVWAGELPKYIPTGTLRAVDPTKEELEGIAWEHEQARRGDAAAKATQEQERRDAEEAERNDRQVFGVALR